MSQMPREVQSGGVAQAPIESPGLPLTETDRIIAELGREIFKGTPAVAQDGCKHLVTITTFLLGGSVVFLQPGAINPSFKIIALLSFGVSFFCALWGSLPSAEVFSPQCLTDVRMFYHRIVTQRTWALRVSVFALSIGLSVAVIGAALR